jgi:hypothetical protein
VSKLIMRRRGTVHLCLAFLSLPCPVSADMAEQASLTNPTFRAKIRSISKNNCCG